MKILSFIFYIASFLQDKLVNLHTNISKIKSFLYLNNVQKITLKNYSSIENNSSIIVPENYLDCLIKEMLSRELPLSIVVFDPSYTKHILKKYINPDYVKSSINTTAFLVYKNITFFDFYSTWTNGVIDEKNHILVSQILKDKEFNSRYINSYENNLLIKKIFYVIREARLNKNIYYLFGFQTIGLIQKVVKASRIKKCYILYNNKQKPIVCFYNFGFFIGSFLSYINFYLNKVSKFFSVKNTDNTIIYKKEKKIILKNYSIYKNIAFINTRYEDINKHFLCINYNGNFNKLYWQGMSRIIKFSKEKKKPLLIITGSYIFYIFMSLMNIACILCKREINKSQNLSLKMTKDSIHQENLSIIKFLLTSLNVKKIIVLPHWSNFGANLISVCQKLSIKTISFPVCTIAPIASSIIKWDELDFLGCYGSQSFQSFENFDISNKKLFLTGFIPFSKKEILKKDFFFEKRCDVIIATSRMDQNENNWIEKVYEYCVAKNLRLVICAHPSFSITIYKKSLKKHKNLKILQGNFYPYLKNSKLCITDCSTVGAEAVFLEKMLMVVNLTNKEFLVNDYASLGVAIKVTMLEDINQSLEDLLENKHVQGRLKDKFLEFYEKYNYKCDDKAVDRLIDFYDSIE